ncbi:MAG: hypothetical protein FD123_1184 [Bacteroidetes bacterium]|nr:MAG: hypothetical protein FD123_1184 [Bacteroidota bacterium]
MSGGKTAGFFVKVFNYEYWPMWLLFLPLMPYWFWLAIRSRSFTFFTASNTNIELGGFYGESKIAILEQIPEEFLPPTVFIRLDAPFAEAQRQAEEKKIVFPFIAKPDVGGGGKGVEVIVSWAHLAVYHESIGEDYIIQGFAEEPLELGVFYIRMPGEEKGKVTSVVIKEFLSVKGDGRSSILQLLQADARARFQVVSMQAQLGEGINEIIPAGETRLLEPIGNHSRGTRFVNGNHLINEQLHAVFNRIAAPMDGFYYGRFDLKVANIDALYRGESIRVLELNGASSDPGHIFDQRTGFWRSMRDVAWHWKQLARISRINRKRGIRPAPLSEVVRLLWLHKLSKKKKVERISGQQADKENA